MGNEINSISFAAQNSASGLRSNSSFSAGSSIETMILRPAADHDAASFSSQSPPRGRATRAIRPGYFSLVQKTSPFILFAPKLPAEDHRHSRRAHLTLLRGGCHPLSYRLSSFSTKPPSPVSATQSNVQFECL